MTRRHFLVQAHSRAPVGTVKALLDDADRWTRWARPILAQTRWEKWGDPIPAGPGAVRRLGTWPMWIREQILTNTDRVQTYTVVSPPLFSHYLGTVELTAAPDGGTDVSWQVEFVSRVPGGSGAAYAVLHGTISALAKRLAAAADRSG
ncbi:MAG: SRPBCC family protein [Mycobacterium sp.]|nr:SRPBCC family protein [Mycobacterium sp.]